MSADRSVHDAGVRPAVLVVIKGLGLGGAERLVVDQVTAPGGRCRYEVAYLRPDKNHFVPQLRAAGVAVHDVSAESGPWPLTLLRLLRRRRPAIVHVHSPLPAAFVRILVRLGLTGRRTRIVYTEHNRWSAYRLPTRLVNAVTMLLDHTGFAVSEEARSSIRPARLRRRVETLHHGIDLDALREQARAGPNEPVPDAPAGAFVLLHVANGRPEKAHEVLIEAFDLAADRNPALRLQLVGQHLDRPWIAEAIERCRHRDRLDVVGFRSDVPALLAGADALVLSSDHEGLPVAVMEAMALGRPVVSTSVGGIPEVVRDGIEGLLVEPRDPKALADSMLRLSTDVELRNDLAARAARAAQAFDRARAITVLEDRYRQLVAGRQ